MSDHQHLHAFTVGTANAVVTFVGGLDFLHSLTEKVLVAFLVAVISGFGYQVGRVVWTKLTGRKAAK